MYIPEFEDVVLDPKTAFLQEYFTEAEYQYCMTQSEKRIASSFAGRYGAKEALIKAMDSGHLHEKPAIAVRYKDIEMLNDDHGRPFYRLHGSVNEYLSRLGIVRSHLTVSHTGDYAVAMCILEI